jgi:uroporphyrinogen-III synthase
MTQSLTNRTIALAEGRQLEELASMLEKEGAAVLRCPLLSILDAPDDAPVLEWLDRLQGGAFDWVILFTGEGVRRLLACADRHGRRDAFIESFAKTRTLTRGPKPVKALKELSVAPTLIAPAPTTDGVITALRTLDLQGRAVGVQLYSESNPPLLAYLHEAGATAYAVQPYIYAPASDAERVLQLIEQMNAGSVDAIVFTSSPQIDRLFAIAEERQQIPRLTQAFAKTLVAAVGPLVQENLQRRNVAVQVCPEQGFVMKNLVQHLKKALGR